jgi:hypothetical protein
MTSPTDSPIGGAGLKGPLRYQVSREAGCLHFETNTNAANREPQRSSYEPEQIDHEGSGIGSGSRTRRRSLDAQREGASLRPMLLLAVLLGTLITGRNVMAFEKRAYEVVEHDRVFEVRSYSQAIVAETIVEGEFESVGSEAFRILVAYISGENEARESIAMTAPVTQESKGRKVAMTAPVTQESSKGGYRITFMMPSTFTLETLPVPRDERIHLRQDPAQRYVAIRYSGFWSRRNYERHLSELRGWIHQRNLKPKGGPVWVRYDPPFMPWFLPKNEILIPVTQ